ncbi:hypothetical protein M0R45_000740 [Rubus argutus]|uniref:Zinc knuckle CX2CX4HX4C domain-containing protein n=1 Tax=Rubus argutus TaxID=59490 RepID=A0AAW1VSJ7_RUBAR
MRTIAFWNKVSNVPPLFVTRETASTIGSTMGKFLSVDPKYTGVEALLEFDFENLAGWCSKCGLIAHFGRNCDSRFQIPASQASSSSLSKLAGGLFANLGTKTLFTAGSTSLVFTEPIPKAPMANPFANLVPQVVPSREQRVVAI